MSFDLWRVYHFHSTTTNPPKPKFAVCFDSGPPALFFFINTVPRIHGIAQFPLVAGEHAVLTHDSYLDLAECIIPPPMDLKTATERAPFAKALRDRIEAELRLGNLRLPERYRRKAVESLEKLK